MLRRLATARRFRSLRAAPPRLPAAVPILCGLLLLSLGLAWLGPGDGLLRPGPRPAVAQDDAAPEVPAPAAPPPSTGSGLVDWFLLGGVFMWTLLVCSILGLAAIIERAFAIRRASVDTRRFIARVVDDMRAGGLPAALARCQQVKGPIAAIVHSGLLKAPRGPQAVEKAIEAAAGIEVAFLQRGLIILASVANIAPLLGFLGTVSGMIHAFEAIAAAEQVSARLVASGIAEALITTEAGLCIAIPVQGFYNYYVSRIDRFVVEIEESAIELIAEVEKAAPARPEAAR